MFAATQANDFSRITVMRFRQERSVSMPIFALSEAPAVAILKAGVGEVVRRCIEGFPLSNPLIDIRLYIQAVDKEVVFSAFKDTAGAMAVDVCEAELGDTNWKSVIGRQDAVHVTVAFDYEHCFPRPRFESTPPKSVKRREEMRRLRQKVAVEGVSPSEATQTTIDFADKQHVAYRFTPYANMPRFLERFARAHPNFGLPL